VCSLDFGWLPPEHLYEFGGRRGAVTFADGGRRADPAGLATPTRGQTSGRHRVKVNQLMFTKSDEPPPNVR
jgi:hypothetical protein